MKTKVVTVSFCIAFSLFLLLIASCTKDNKQNVEHSSEIISSSEVDIASCADSESSESPTGPSVDESIVLLPQNSKAYKFKQIIDSGEYRVELTKQKRIGGFSMPITIITYVSGSHINILEYEGHDICTEVLINDKGTYFINSAEKSALLMPRDAYTPINYNLDGLILLEKGMTTLGTSTYYYEKFQCENGMIVDFLFSDDELVKLKSYSSNDDYLLYSIAITNNTTGIRTDALQGFKITDIRSNNGE